MVAAVVRCVSPLLAAVLAPVRPIEGRGGTWQRERPGRGNEVGEGGTEVGDRTRVVALGVERLLVRTSGGKKVLESGVQARLALCVAEGFRELYEITLEEGKVTKGETVLRIGGVSETGKGGAAEGCQLVEGRRQNVDFVRVHWR
eukprot:972924-Pleurochrysis_carterae.AAC.1